MYNSVFGDVSFSVGWKTTTTITLFGRNHQIIVKAKAYFEQDGITAEQENAYQIFNDTKRDRLSTVEKLLGEYVDEKANTQFTPRAMLFKRNGDYALLLDDVEDMDCGIAVTLSPRAEVVSQDAYL